MSFRSEIPLIKAANISGIAINFKELINIVQKGLIQSPINEAPQSKLVSSSAKSTPTNIPKRIFQCNSNFFIYCINNKVKVDSKLTI